MKIHIDGSRPLNGEFFVFGSNLAGYHGGGAAYAANRYYGAEMGVGEGLTGNSYAIPTKDENIETLPLSQVVEAINRFNKFAKENPNMEFFLTRVGCVLAGYSDEEIAPLFDYLNNVNYPEPWKGLIKTT